VKRWLALDTSTWWGGVALLEEDAGEIREVAEVRLFVRDSHAARLLGAVDAALAAAGWSRDDLDAFAAVRGPGSFTGIRVGLGLLAGLAVSSGKPCVGVDALESLAEAFGPAEAERVPLLDAARGEVYGARYDATSSPPRPLRDPWIGPPERAAEPGEAPGIAFGSGAVLHRDVVGRIGLRVAGRPTPTRGAAAAGRIAARRLGAGTGDAPGLAPLYLRPSDAEIGRR
jgi:tRNA threonylcarbamoyladenosine biosynthesis protein TsaB